MTKCARKVSEQKAHKNVGKLTMVINNEHSDKGKPQAAAMLSLQEAKEKRCELRAEAFYAYTQGDKDKEQRLMAMIDNLGEIINDLAANEPTPTNPTARKVKPQNRPVVTRPTEEPPFLKGNSAYNIIANDLSTYPKVELSLVKKDEYKPKTIQIITEHVEITKTSQFFTKINKILNIFTHNRGTKREN